MAQNILWLFITLCQLTLKPPDLRSRAVALLVAGGNAEDDGGFGGVVDVGVGQAGSLDQAGRVWPTVHPHEGQLSRGRCFCLGRLRALDGQVDRVLYDLPRRHRWRLPGKMSTVRALIRKQNTHNVQ